MHLYLPVTGSAGRCVPETPENNNSEWNCIAFLTEESARGFWEGKIFMKKE